MRYEEDVIEEVREKNDIVDVISQYVSLKKKGSSYFGLCPFHNEKSPSFSVSREKQMYYCFGCGQGGNVYTFLMEYNRLSFVEALKELAQRAGVELPEGEQTPEERRQADERTTLKEMNKKAAVYFHYLLKSARGERAMAYLRGRGISDEMIRRFGLGYADIYRDDLYQYLKKQGYSDHQMKESSLVTIDSAKGSYDKFFNRVMFPIMDVNQRVIGFGGRVMGDGEPKYLNSRETILFDKGRNLYGLNYAKRTRESAIILCEGYMDVISLHQAGFTNAVAPLGTAFTPNQAMLLKRYTDEVILSFDSDGAGVKAALRALPILRENGLRGRVLSMKPYKDPDELIKNEGAEGYRKRLKESEAGRMFEMLTLYRQYDQKDPESRTECIRAIAKKLAEIEEPVERNTYLDAAANRFMIVRKDLADLVNRYGMGYQIQKANEQYKKEPESQEKKQERREQSHTKPQRILITWLTEHPEIYPYIRSYVSADDFLNPLYHSVAIMLFEQLDQGQAVNPARIVNQFTEVEEQKEVAALFNAHLRYETSPEDRDKALTDVVKKILLSSIEDEMIHTGDIVKWQELLARKNKVQKLNLHLGQS
ncbi:MAG: DNA primase [Clostridiales bacterium]|uniref:DNA primase n=1 Tax=Candidatus Anaerobutyricum stercoripullorum TaxID=2838456 RepID=A0A9D2BF32_9FIRM|nr:DNA primase [Clostridiales bacterium]HIX72914.1 DNA primase [Candidatus Anaerobutyricum stercoripullorum]